MDLLILLKALILGVVEGLTEFLPISSTGHLIIAGDLLGFNDERGKVFEIVIQLAAILAVVWEYRAKIGQVLVGLPSDPGARKFAFNLIVAFMPAAVLGLMFAGAIKTYLFNPISVSAAFIIGGLLILWAERREHQVRVFSVDEMRWQDALKVGFAQALAMIPGTSRSGATIIGGLFFGLERRTAAEFSFFLAIPTMFAATFYDVYKHREALSFDDIGVFAVGSAASFVSAFLCVRWLLRYISHHDFTVFAWYRIAFGIIVLVTAFTGVVDWSAGG
ncbi:MAG: undecaprenyl-diphosphate phosphatase [Gammaproteobacteria bacterium]|nr:undecaprenyl-diphosphate phosphatase [Gammaproteobacteria bacterium]MBU1653328.1 undecaprenyl-diphosphate phosphatase [Gammaproteobacteria bacterium]MBU1962520.1 undecaprenyl-diphosphate phosphatase [Gammaproteobacteria bacterium]